MNINDNDEQKKFTIKDFLMYLMDNNILTKEDIKKCLKIKKNSKEKKSIINILIEEKFIKSKSEYNKLWQEMIDCHENFKVSREITFNQGYGISESVLKELISSDIKKTQVSEEILHVASTRWKEDIPKIYKENSLEEYAEKKEEAITNQIKKFKIYIHVNKEKLFSFILFSIIGLIFSFLLGLLSFYIYYYSKNYHVQEMQVNLEYKEKNKFEIIVKKVKIDSLKKMIDNKKVSEK